MEVIGYVRVSTAEQAATGSSPEAQRRAIEEETSRRGWHLIRFAEDSASGRTLRNRPALELALADIENGHAGGLVVAKLDRLSRSVKDFADLTERSMKRGWALVALDLGVDTTTPAGEAMANVLAAFAQFERRMIGLRTKEGLAIRKSQGVRLGRPPVLEPRIVSRIKRLASRGYSLSEIARRLTEDGTPTAHGGKRWYPSSVRAVINRVNS